MTMMVRCVGYNTSHERYFTVGKTYEWCDGNLTSDVGHTYTKDCGADVRGTDPSKWGLRRWYEFEVVDDDQTIDTDAFEISFDSLMNGVSRR